MVSRIGRGSLASYFLDIAGFLLQSLRPLNYLNVVYLNILLRLDGAGEALADGESVGGQLVGIWQLGAGSLV